MNSLRISDLTLRRVAGALLLEVSSAVGLRGGQSYRLCGWIVLDRATTSGHALLGSALPRVDVSSPLFGSEGGRQKNEDRHVDAESSDQQKNGELVWSGHESPW